uniref:RNA-guided endonuclease TnpB family protein n=1 Tax=Okeania sp. SIO2F4 TaxID=2607790 RepID=UPI0025D8A5AB|nr:RNA-guided endonuclease TnpB family protein [Okeania sp. SIO2F4]
MKKAVNLYERRRLRVAKLHAKVKDIRTDFLHKLSTDLVKKYDTIVLEDLNVSGMVKNRKLSKTISDLGWRKFRILTEAKCEKYGKEFRVIDRWEPTSQKCSCCGFKGGKKELNVREWTCLSCGAHHDRDINAAVNILEVVQPKTKVKAVKETVAENPIQLSLFEEVAEGQRSIIYRTWSRRNSTRKKVVDGNDVSTRPEFFKQLSLFD